MKEWKKNNNTSAIYAQLKKSVQYTKKLKVTIEGDEIIKTVKLNCKDVDR